MTAAGEINQTRLNAIVQHLEITSGAFRSQGTNAGKNRFSQLSVIAIDPAFEQAVYFNLWRNRNEPPGNEEYGRYCFHDINGLSSTAQEKADAIDKLVRQIRVYLHDPSFINVLRQIYLDFRNDNAENGMLVFSYLFTTEQHRVIEFDIYYNLWKIKTRPQGNQEYGRECFHNMNNLSSTSQEKADAIILLFQNSLLDCLASFTTHYVSYSSTINVTPAVPTPSPQLSNNSTPAPFYISPPVLISSPGLSNNSTSYPRPSRVGETLGELFAFLFLLIFCPIALPLWGCRRRS